MRVNMLLITSCHVTIALSGCFPVPDEVKILAVTANESREIVAEIETLNAGQRTLATLAKVQFQFLIDQAVSDNTPPPIIWSDETTTWLPGPDEDTRLFSVTLDSQSLGIDALRPFDRVVVTATVWEGGSEPEDGLVDEAVYFYWDNALQSERPKMLDWDLSGLAQNQFGQPIVPSNEPVDAAIGPFARVTLSSPRRVDTVVSLMLTSVEEAGVEAWFATNAENPLNDITIPAGSVASGGFVITGPELEGNFSQGVYGPKWSGASNEEQGEGTGLVFRADALINGLEDFDVSKVTLVD